MGIVYGSVCSGIEAASVAWEPLGWKAAWFSEIESFPKAVLQHRYPDIPNLGDMTKLHRYDTFKESKIDVLVGGTPCQSFSIAGEREGMDDERGNLALVFCELARRSGARWTVWENVPGVLSSSSVEDEEGRYHHDLGTILRSLQKCGYQFAYRVLNARNFGVPQNRRRIFVVGHRGDDWRPAAAVLFDEGSCGGNSAADGEGQGNAERGIQGGAGKDGWIANSGDSVRCLSAGGIKRINHTADTFLIHPETGGIRYLTPVEWERAQGFPDNWTQVPFGGKPAEQCPWTPRYVAIGNSMAVPVMQWIGRRIAYVDSLTT